MLYRIFNSFQYALRIKKFIIEVHNSHRHEIINDCVIHILYLNGEKNVISAETSGFKDLMKFI